MTTPKMPEPLNIVAIQTEIMNKREPHTHPVFVLTQELFEMKSKYEASEARAKDWEECEDKLIQCYIPPVVQLHELEHAMDVYNNLKKGSV